MDQKLVDAIRFYREHAEAFKALQKEMASAEKLIKEQGIGFVQSGVSVEKYRDGSESISLVDIKKTDTAVYDMLKSKGFVKQGAPALTIKIDPEYKEPVAEKKLVTGASSALQGAFDFMGVSA
jgi:hypothetical protein